MKKKKSDNFSFQNSLKEGPRYPIIHYLRIERYFTRPLASLIVRLIFKTKITPNHITVLAFILGIISAILFSLGEYKFFIAAGIFIQFSSVFDCADGMLARSKNMCTRYGAFLDLFLDRIADIIILSGISAGYFIYSGNSFFLLLSLLATVLYALQIILFYMIKMFRNKLTMGDSAEARGLLIFAILVFSVLNKLDILILIVLVQAVFSISVRTIIFYRLRSEKDTNIPEF